MQREASRRDFLKAASLGMAGLDVLNPSMNHAAEYLKKDRKKKVEMAIATITMDGLGTEISKKLLKSFHSFPLKMWNLTVGMPATLPLPESEASKTAVNSINFNPSACRAVLLVPPATSSRM